VAYDDQFAVRLRPGGQQRLKQNRQLRAVLGNRQARVVAQVDRREGELGLQLAAELSF
jgi:hypothetical protein